MCLLTFVARVVYPPQLNTYIYDKNPGPSASTAYGVQDYDNLYPNGPDNIFWPFSGHKPPRGVYKIVSLLKNQLAIKLT